MTFEEFFQKKKIDLLQLQKTEASLFAEFKSHYEVMGEKSFDHSKKFWFNKLRRLYHIKEEPKPAKATIEVNQIASQAIPLSSPEPEVKKGFTPRFKAKATQENPIIEDKVIEEQKSEVDLPKPAAFKPRFKPQMVKSASIPPTDKPSEVLSEEAADSPNPTTEEINSENKAAETDQPRPVYKPRFKPQMAKPAQPITETTADFESSEESRTELPNSEINKANIIEEEGAVKPAFKPKFTPRNFKPKSE